MYATTIKINIESWKRKKDTNVHILKEICTFAVNTFTRRFLNFHLSWRFFAMLCNILLIKNIIRIMRKVRT